MNARTLQWAVRNAVARMAAEDGRQTWWPPVGSWEHIALCRDACAAIRAALLPSSRLNLWLAVLGVCLWALEPAAIAHEYHAHRPPVAHLIFQEALR